jgi:hypothetical protein
MNDTTTTGWSKREEDARRTLYVLATKYEATTEQLRIVAHAFGFPELCS